MASGYGGTYRAVVMDNLDPLGENRVSVKVPDVGIESAWASPLAAGSRVPSVGDEVLVQFEGGDTDHPVWHADGAAAPAPAHYPGVYRAVVVDSADPMQSHRLQVQVPEVLGNEPTWASPSPALGSAPEIPGVGTGVWVQFESGDPDHAEWTGVQ
jgi:uncharacterized protein involved in type VI secretion and phage assembly